MTIMDKELENAAEVPDNRLSTALSEYVAKVRGGDVGALPAVLGLLVLAIVFSAVRAETFPTAFNFGNLLNQGAGVIVIAMGLVFVLLLGEIDLSAGYTAGTAAAVLGIVVTNHGAPWWVGLIACLATGAVVGLVIGLLVARLGIPSFVVTLALFLALQGVLLQIIGEGGQIALTDPTLLSIMNNNLPGWAGWALYLLIVLVYGGLTFRRMTKRRADGLHAERTSVWAFKMVALVVLLGLVTYLLSIERSVNPAVTSIKGVPVVVPVLLFLLVVTTVVLNRTSFGRHIYAVGGNAEAARRSGINVANIRLACFVICSTMAAVAGILIMSRDNGVTPNTGGGQTLLYAVGAAVIGGTSLFGGKGRPIDAIIGGLVVAIIANGMALLNQPAGVVYFVTGLVLLVAASVDALSRRRAAATGR
ncbi:MAG TPA: ABC transporter permease [Candidatus Nanopelagicales bacterium]|nr:ABC transporter permease [Candidatus Nanopelagicales bacterium]